MSKLHFLLSTLLIFIFCSCTKELQREVSEGQFLFQGPVRYPCVDIDTSSYFIQYGIQENQICLNEKHIISPYSCSSLGQSLFRVLIAGPEENGSIQPMPVLKIDLGHFRILDVQSSNSTLKANNLLADESYLRHFKVELWFSDIEICAYTEFDFRLWSRVQVFGRSSFLQKPFGENAFFIIHEVEPIAGGGNEYIISFTFQMDLFDSNHKRIKLRQGRGRVPIRL